MADFIEAMNRKKANLSSQRKQIKVEADRKIAEIDAEIARLNQAIRTLNDVAKEHFCDVCKGAGIIRIADSVGQTMECQCPSCKGTGIRSSSGGAVP